MASNRQQGAGPARRSISGPAASLETPAQVKERHDFYMYDFRTEYCPNFPVYKCDKSKPYSCTLAHYSNHLRRNPVVGSPSTRPGAISFLISLFGLHLLTNALFLQFGSCILRICAFSLQLSTVQKVCGHGTVMIMYSLRDS